MSIIEFPQEFTRIRYPEIDSSSEIGSIKGEEDQHPKASIVDDYLYVAVGNTVKENKSTVIWALQNSGGKKICILHVHTPAQLIPFLGGKFPISQVGKQVVTTYQQKERNEMHKALDEYHHLCAKAGVNAQTVCTEADSIENGIISLISTHMISRLVMGAAADNRYKKSMTLLKSKKAIYVQTQAPSFCKIWFVCKGYLIYTREGVEPYPRHESGETSVLGSPLRTEAEVFHDTDGGLSSRMSNESSSESELFSKLSFFDSARPSTSSDVFMGSPREARFVDEVYAGPSSPTRMPERSVGEGDDVYDQVDKLMVEVDSFKKEAYIESIKRRKAEKETLETIRKAKSMEVLYYEEKKKRRELEKKLVVERKELERRKNLHAKILEDFGVVLHQKSSLEREIETSNLMIEELDEKIYSAVGLLEKYKQERDDFETGLENALLENENLRRQISRVKPSTTQMSRFFTDFGYVEIQEATDNFNPLWIIGEGGFGETYKGYLRHAEVAIKVLSSSSLQGSQEFQREVDALSKLRHPNIVTLIGVCSEASALIYEYLPNGNLEDRLICKNNTPPLSWQTRIHIAAELCSVLMFLHSCQPESIIHGDLKPANILLDAYLSCKLSDFGICRKIDNGERTMNNSMTKFYKTDPKGTFAFMDPEFLTSGELTTKSDVYSFGVILLCLLTGKPALGIVKEVQNALDKDNLNTIMDTSAGDWPFVQANQLALLGLRCCEMQRKNRPNLEEDVWRVLEPMRVSSASANLVGDDNDHVPAFFMCPIFQEVMEDPHIAADGFTYEAEALKGWLDSGHDTSPMTNLKLKNHTLIPNRGLRSAIQEWLQRRRLT